MYGEAQWSSFDVTGPSGQPLAIAALCASCYFDRPVDEIAVAAAEAIERYVSYVGEEALSVYLAPSGLWKPWSTRTLASDLRRLRSFPADHEAAHINYDSPEVPGPFGVAFLATRLNESFERARDNLLRMDFPAFWLREHPAQEVIDFMIGLLETMPVQTASVGLAFKRTEASKSKAKQGVHSKLQRYLGFDPCYSDVRNSMRDHTFTAHWLNYVDQRLATKLGGLKQITAKLPDCQVHELSSGVLIRGAKLPPIGDCNRGAKDLGCLPDVARVLKPARSQIRAFGTPDFDAQQWLARLDKLTCGPWDNGRASK
jgi:hypothetical protein